jgi:2-polyprenyl-3-methyl-5-hydroxy-6-metoxy-1,4-benzoquinol methylase
MDAQVKASSGSLGAGSAAIGRARRSSMTCLLCGGGRQSVAFREFDVDILRCRDCGHVFSSYEAKAHYDGFWGTEVADPDPYWSAARESMYHDFRRRFIAGRSGRLLDMGCGLGFFAKGVAQSPGWQAYGCEISPAAVRYAREKLRLSTIVCSRLEDADLPSGSFDVITMWDVIDHILHPDPLLNRCHSLLKEGGFCFIRTPNIRIQLLRARVNRAIKGMRPGATFLQAGDHAHHYSPSSIRRLLERNGFTQVEFVPTSAAGEGRVVRSRAGAGGPQRWRPEL